MVLGGDVAKRSAIGWILSLAGLLALAACGDESGAQAPVCPAEIACEISERQCVGDLVQLCVPDASGCATWSPLSTCAPGACDGGVCGQAPECRPAPEVCDGVDNNCNGLVDERLLACESACQPECDPRETRCDDLGALQVCVQAAGCLVWSAPRGCGPSMVCRSGACAETPDCHDFDGDGVGVGSDCEIEDCNDAHDGTFPGAEEVCDRRDNNCDGAVDEDLEGCRVCEDDCEASARQCDGRDLLRCVTGPDGCTLWDVSERCGAEEACEAAACVPYVCDADALEPNDSPELASEPTGDTFDAEVCRGDTDWFALGEVLASHVAHVAITSEAPPGTIEAALLDGEVLGASSVLGADRAAHLFWQVEADTALFLRVSSRIGGAGSYSVAWEILDPEVCLPDGFEPNEGLEEAADLAPDTEARLSLCGDEDWFGLGALEPGEQVFVEVDDAAIFGGRVDAELVDAEGVVLALSERRGLHFLAWTHDPGAEVEAEVFVRLISSGSLSGEAVLRHRRFVPESCSGADLEPNDLPDLAVPIETFEVDGVRRGAVEGEICLRDEDWFVIAAVPADSLIEVEVVSPGVDLDVELHSVGRRRVARAAGGRDSEVLRYEVPFERRGAYFVRVLGFGASRGAYEVRVRVALPPVCEDDGLEPNDQPNAGTPIESEQRHVAFLCRGDLDWYTIGELERRQIEGHIQLSLNPMSAGTLTMELFRQNIRVAVVEATEPGVVTIDHAVQRAGFYTAVVAGPLGDEGDYTIEYVYVGPPPCEDDAQEPNDDRTEAAPIEVGVEVAAQICEGDADWFQIDAPVSVGQRIEVDVLFSHEDGDLDVRLYRDTERVAESDGADDDERIVHEVRGEGTYSIEIYGFEGAEAPYEVVVEID